MVTKKEDVMSMRTEMRSGRGEIIADVAVIVSQKYLKTTQ